MRKPEIFVRQFDFFRFCGKIGEKKRKGETREEWNFQFIFSEYNRSNADYETIYRPEGKGTICFCCFKTPMKVYDRTAFSLHRKMPAFYTPDHEQHYQAVQKFRNSYVHFWCGKNLGETYGIPQNAVFIHRTRKQLMS